MAYEPPPPAIPPAPEDWWALRDAYQVLAERLRQTELELGRFSSVLAHDLRGHLRGIDAFCTFLEEDLEPHLGAEELEHLSRIAQLIRASDGLVESALCLLREVRRPVELTVVPVLRTVTRALERAKERHPEALFERVPGPTERLPTTMDAQVDSGRLDRILDILLENALTFIPKGATPFARVEVSPHGGELLLRVVDKGIGISPSDRMQLFELGCRLNPKCSYPGAGFGLYLSRRLAEGFAKGPRLMRSEVGVGSVFEVRLTREVSG